MRLFCVHVKKIILNIVEKSIRLCIINSNLCKEAHHGRNEKCKKSCQKGRDSGR